MDIIQLKIEKDSSVASYIKIIRKFDDSLSVGTIKQRIDQGDFVIGFDLEYYDALEDINEIDRKKLFRLPTGIYLCGQRHGKAGSPTGPAIVYPRGFHASGSGVRDQDGFSGQAPRGGKEPLHGGSHQKGGHVHPVGPGP